MKIGIFGGTFNPIHQGHLIGNEYIRQELGLDKIIFMPASQPPHKEGQPIVDGQKRLFMLDLALEGNPYFDISTIELDREGRSYTIDSIRQLKKQYPNDQLYLIIGADSFLNIETWRKPDQIMAEVQLIILDRPSQRKQEIAEKIENFQRDYGNKIISIPTPLIEISSSMIRERIRVGKSIKYLLPKRVEEYIKAEKLYQEAD